MADEMDRAKADRLIDAAPKVHLLPDDVLVMQLPADEMSPYVGERLHDLFSPRKIVVIADCVRIGHADAGFGSVHWTLG